MADAIGGSQPDVGQGVKNAPLDVPMDLLRNVCFISMIAPDIGRSNVTAIASIRQPLRGRVEMKSRLFVIIGAAAALASTAAIAQMGPAGRSPAEQPTQQQAQAGSGTSAPRMPGPGMMGDMGIGGMMGMMGGGPMGPGGMTGPALRILFALVDSDGNGTIELQEFQAAHERIFKAIDADKDGKVTLQEMLAFMQGSGALPQRP